LLLLRFRRSRLAIPLGFALLGFLVQLLELFRLFGARLAIAFRTLLTVIRPECHGRSFSGIRARKSVIRRRRFRFDFSISGAWQAYTRPGLKTSQGAACYRIGRNSPISGAEIGGENFGAATGKDRGARARSRGGRAAASRMSPIRQPPIVGADSSNLKISPAVRTLLRQGSFGTSKAAGIEAQWRRRSAAGGSRLSRNPMPRNVPIPHRQPAAADGTIL